MSKCNLFSEEVACAFKSRKAMTRDNLEQKWIEYKGTITENDWKQKVSNDTVITGENYNRMFNRQITCCARLKVK